MSARPGGKYQNNPCDELTAASRRGLRTRQGDPRRFNLKEQQEMLNSDHITRHPLYRRILRRLAAASAALVLVVATAQSANADCVRHIYNQSSTAWVVRCLNGSSDLCCLRYDNGCQETFAPRQPGLVHYFYILPGETVEIKYGCLLADRLIELEAQAGSPYNYKFNISLGAGATLCKVADALFTGCAYLEHPNMGNTGRATLNEPADGDIILLN